MQFWPHQEGISFTVTAQGGIPRELTSRRNRLQLQFLVFDELINQYSYSIGTALQVRAASREE